MQYCIMRVDDAVRLTRFLLFVIYITYSTSAAHHVPWILSLECPGNDVSQIRQTSMQLELSMIFYYVPWCRQSRAAKDVYLEIARQYTNEVNFAAINCWHFECNCSHTIPSSVGSKEGNPHKWPTLIVNYGRHTTLQYHDEWSVIALSRFINNLLKPIVRLNSKDDLKMLNMRSGAVLLGLFENEYALEYHRFTIAAIKWLENDPQKLVIFAVCLGSTAKDIVKSLTTSTPLIILVMDQEISVFKSMGNWRSNHLIAWLQNEVQRLSKHFVGFSTPRILSEHVRRGTVLAIFANDQDHSNRNFYAHMSSIMESMGFFPFTNSHKKKCNEMPEVHGLNIDNYKLFNETNEVKDDDDDEKTINCNHNKKSFVKCSLRFNRNYETLMKSNLKISQYYIKKFQPSAQHEMDDHSTKKLLHYFKYNECLKAYQSQHKPELQIVFGKLLAKFIEKVAQNSRTRHNRTMSVQILDAAKHHDIIHNLGVSHLDNVNRTKTTVLIIEPNQEGIYVMHSSFHYEALLAFIKDYYDNNLSILRKTGYDVSSSSTSSSSSSHSSSVPTYKVQDLNRQAFLHKIQHFAHNTTTVLLLYSPRCVFSSLMAHALVQVSALLHKTQNAHNINMVRLNTQTNDLPWEFLMHTTPALIVFPKGQPSESRLFPSNLKINVKNVFAFILAQLEPIEQLRVVLASCSPPHHPTHQLTKCLQFVRLLAMQHIGDHLKLWQIFKNERQAILARLRQFKDITLNIQEKFLL